MAWGLRSFRSRDKVGIMKSGLTAFIALSILSIAAFGFLAMGHGAGSEHGGFCFGAIAQSVPCPEKDPLGFASFHLTVFQNFSQAVFSADFLSTLLLTTLLAIALFSLKISFFVPQFNVRYGEIQGLADAPFPLVQKLNHWLALHENSPSVL